MDTFESLNHSVWDCKYHVVFIPKCRRKAIHLARVYGERKRNFVGQHFWARGYFVSTVGRDETVIKEYIRRQEEADTRLDQLGLWR